ncbi:2-amino-4-hydroxy-6-hydroxymethyldihydropteridine diphosphokinase [Ketobacter sp.]|uniref:2-amino-4-hydroxy-6- hydroxymethyldihydropteridine diphosphokinase n=1 Tax=Ketobacter sp. TaxID=2083498 RepID=UPI000F176573|nr:2-amino-4-hydroxy-6-hydroxymethyldihydropteridine diphosphokinase [Ketobacter sp.]RLT98704.1 MAG: 2-amino-4-hydroxy-6-hydroxymethyldihydropteridine diphosphokinase [Ketobacter sp.]
MSSQPSPQKCSHYAIVSVGTNIEPEINLQKSRAILQAEMTLLGEAKVIQTAPDGYQLQPDFLNGAYYVGTELTYEAFNQYLKDVEKRLGRVKGPIKSGPRCIDLDIIVWDGEVVHDDYRQNKHYVVDPVNELLDRFQIAIEPR